MINQSAFQLTVDEDLPYLWRDWNSEDSDHWNVPRCDLSITPGWYWHLGDTPKILERLTFSYFACVGQNAAFLLGLPADKTGRLPPVVAERLEEFGSLINRTFRVDYAQGRGATVKASSFRGSLSAQYAPWNVLSPDHNLYWTMDDGITTGWIEIDFGKVETFDIVSIVEHIPLGQRVRAFTCEIFSNKAWRIFAKGTTIGAKRLLRRYPVNASKLRVTFTDCRAVPVIESISIFKAVDEMSLEGYPPPSLSVIGYAEFGHGAGWIEKELTWYANGTDCDMSKTITCSMFWIVGTVDPSFGKMRVSVEGWPQGEVSLYSSTHAQKQILFESRTFKYQRNHINIEQIGPEPIAIHAVYAVRNSGIGLLDLNDKEYSVPQGESVKIQIVRRAGHKKQINCTFQTYPENARPNVDYESVSEDMTFEEEEDQKEITIKTHKGGAGSSFHVELLPRDEAIIGFNWTAVVNIVINDLEDENRTKIFGSNDQANWGLFVVMWVMRGGVALATFAFLGFLLKYHLERGRIRQGRPKL
jgi:alpha-L-fucosidase